MSDAEMTPGRGEQRVFDFRRWSWGHAMHASSWRELSPSVTGAFWWRRLQRRTSVLIHATPCPNRGDLVLYRGETGDFHGRVVEVESFFSPHDMYQLTLEPLGLWKGIA